MSQTVDIGAARVRLIVDADDFDSVVAQGKNAVRGFGQEAQQAYDRTEKATRRAADTLLDYVNSLGRADTSMDRYVRNASRLGVEKPVLDAAVAAWRQKTDAIELSTKALADQAAHVKTVQTTWKQFQAEQKTFDDEEKARAERAARDRAANLADAAAANAQNRFNALLGVRDPTPDPMRRDAAASTLLPVYQSETAELEKQKNLQELIASARAKHTADQAQVDFNRLLGIDAQQDSLALTRRRADAEAAFNNLQESHVDAFRANQAQRQASGDAYIKQLQNTEVAAGKTYYELLRLKAAELGVADAAAPIIAKIEAQNQAMGRGTVSAKQYALAVRQLPAQFTDVFTSLVAGQNPLLVLLQQGGQVKDMFGGVKAAIGAVAKESLLLLKNPYVLLAAAIATVAVAAYQADTRITALAVSAAKGNGIAGTARQLSLYAEQLNGLANINLSGADAAVSKLAEGGRLAGENFRRAAEASARWASVTGDAVDDVAGKFESIARDPMAAVLEGTVKITSAQYDQIRALIEAGDQAKAVTELVKIYYDQINDNSQTVVNNLSAVSREWRDIKDSVTSAWHETQQYFEYLLGAGLKAQERFNALPWYTKLAPGSGILATLRGLADQTAGERVGTEKGRRADPMPTGGESAKLSRLQITANEDLAKSWDNSGDKAERLKAKVDKLNATLRNATDSALAQRDIVRGPNGTFSGKGYDRLVKALDDKTKGPKAVRQGPDPTKEIQEREKTALAQLRKIQQEFDYAYADRESTIESYYAKSVFLAREEADVQIKSNNEQIAALKGRRDSEDKIAALEQQNNTINEQFAAKKAKLDRDEVLATRQRTDALRDYLQALTDANAQLAQGFAQSTRAVGRGGRNPEMLNALDGVLTDSNRRLRAIDNDRSLTDSEAADRRATEYDALAEKQLIIVQGYANIREAESNWLNGATKSWEDWLQQVGDIATQVGSITTSAMNGMVDSISSKIRTGSSGFKDYLDDLNRQILDFVLKQQLTKFFKSIGEAGAGTDWGSAVMKFGSALFGTANAQGNVFGGGVLANYRNKIVSQPTYFAQGGVPNVNLMGERSGKPHEAIMPLTRTAGGDLGVKVVGQGQQRTTNISQTFIVPGVADRTTRDQLAIKTLGAAQRAARRA